MFYEKTFNDFKHGFSLGGAQEEMRRVNAAKILQRAVKRFLMRKRARELRRKGAATITGILNCDGVILLYLFIIDDKRRYKFSLKEKKTGNKILSRHPIQNQDAI